VPKKRKRRRQHLCPRPSPREGCEFTSGGGEPEWFERLIIESVQTGYAAWERRQKKRVEREGGVYASERVQTRRIEQPIEFFSYVDRWGET